MASNGLLPLAKWPTLLVGPMVRRVTRERANVFIATSVESSAELLIYSGIWAHGEGTPLKRGDSTPLSRIGSNLWVGLLSVQIPDIPDLELISYDVRLLAKRQGVVTEMGLHELGLLGGVPAASGREGRARRALYPLGYEEGYLPSFLLPPRELSELRLVHGSCRKPHGGKETEADALQIVDAVIHREGATSGLNRPHQLVLTGDQIYADDVGSGLLSALTAVGEELFGWDEPIPTAEGPLKFLTQPGWRTRFLSMEGINLRKSPKTDPKKDDYSGSHLLRFSEWCAMYIFVWSDALWAYDAEKDKYELPTQPAELPVDAAARLIDVIKFLGWAAPPAKFLTALDIGRWLKEFQEKVNLQWKETNPKVLGFAETLCQIRRVFANVSTYMMFDDHEITDDWNLNKRLEQRLKGDYPVADDRTEARQVGPRLLRNGLSAYAIFQHWGNVPDDFTSNPESQGHQLLNKWRITSGGVANAELRTTPRSADVLLGITPGDSTAPARKPNESLADWRRRFTRLRWDYAITFPTHRLIVLDTRTWRFFPAEEKLTFASLVPARPLDRAQAPEAGATQLVAVATAWEQAAIGSHKVVATALADLVRITVSMAEAVNEPAASQKDRVVDLAETSRRFLDAIPERAQMYVRLDPIAPRIPVSTDRVAARQSLGTLNDGAAIFGAATDLLRDVSRHDSGMASLRVGLVVEALAQFLDAAFIQSLPGMAHAARRVAHRAGPDLWSALAAASSASPPPDALRVAVEAAVGILDTLCAETGLDELAAKLFRDGDNRLAPGLIHHNALSFQVSAPIAELGSPSQPTFVVSPAPVFGNVLVETLQRVGTTAGTALGQASEESLDYESWSVNLVSLSQFFDAVGDIACAVVLSGDVHYASSSVNHVRTLKAEGRYIQLTASSSRNSENKGRILALAEDLMHADESVFVQQQADWMTLIEGKSSAAGHLVNLTRDKIDRAVDDFWATPWLGSQFAEWIGALTYEDFRTAARRAIEAFGDTPRAMLQEAAWVVAVSAQGIRKFRSGYRAIFGDFLTGIPMLRSQLRQVYRDLGVDPSFGLETTSTFLLDRRSPRITEYDALRNRAVGKKGSFKSIDKSQRRTVAHANLGFVQFEMRGEEVLGVRHELRYYPYDDPLPGTKGTRMDWIGSLHRAGWFPHPEDLDKVVRG